MRVRCAIIPSDMLHISTNCRTAEKMALTLLDYLFHREVQAVSNLSGQGKHGKKQLDPLTIYGIRCKCGLPVLCSPSLACGPRKDWLEGGLYKVAFQGGVRTFAVSLERMLALELVTARRGISGSNISFNKYCLLLCP